MKTANNLCADIGYLSINHTGEQLCGDHVEIVEPEDGDSTIVVPVSYTHLTLPTN